MPGTWDSCAPQKESPGAWDRRTANGGDCQGACQKDRYSGAG